MAGYGTKSISLALAPETKFGWMKLVCLQKYPVIMEGFGIQTLTVVPALLIHIQAQILAIRCQTVGIRFTILSQTNATVLLD